VNILLDNKESTPILKTIVVIETPDEAIRSRAASLGIEIISFADVEELGKKNPKEVMVSLWYCSSSCAASWLQSIKMSKYHNVHRRVTSLT
jgi:hypothetical protein